MRSSHVVLASAALLIGAAPAAQAKPDHACPSVAPDSARARELVHSTNYATPGYAMRRQGGLSTCQFSAPGEGSCLLSRPGLTHVTTERTNAYFDVPPDRSARIAVTGGVARCMIGRRLGRTR